ncbi:IS3 family transposase [Sporolactobacillus sp. STCC-11]|uniref:IS3 family transposase n=1 Tax=Sporolactobacillus caesalpiniae TaxID=3230362 RepID=UPI003394F3F8
MRYRFIEAHRDEHSVVLMCTVLNVSKSGYYKWSRGERQETNTQRMRKRKELQRRIKQIFYQNHGHYGSPRIHIALLRQGFIVSQKTIAREMKAMGLRATPKKRYVATTDSRHDLKVYPNLLNRQFQQKAPNQAWVTDMTYIRTLAGWVYLASVIDLFSRKVVGWYMDATMTQDLPLQALKLAIEKRQPGKGLIHHSDQGSQYCANEYIALMKKHQMQISMSRKGDPYDNACMESFHATLKKDLIYRRRFRSREEAIQAINHYIYRYNTYRMHSSLGYWSPNQFEKMHEQAGSVS